MDVTEPGIDREDREQPRNAQTPMDSTDDGMTTSLTPDPAAMETSLVPFTRKISSMIPE
jgi:hypothetical protein